jgi:WD40-like Beta Propeller Repeat
LFVVGLGALIMTVGGLRSGTKPELPPPVAFTVAPEAGTALMPNEAPIISPDGRTLVFVGIGADGIARLFARSLGDVVLHALPGTEGARYPFWSADSRQSRFSPTGASRAWPSAAASLGRFARRRSDRPVRGARTA